VESLAAEAQRSTASYDMRRPTLLLLILLVPTFAACSYSTAFVVLNDSDKPIEVRYKLKRAAGVLSSTETPAIIAASQVANRYRAQWRNLSPTEYQTSQTDSAITVTVKVMPREALWVTSMFHYIGDEDPNDVASWPIDEISITGTNGGMTFTGQKARKSFNYVSRVLYTLTYE
jgi:hypothetical protein